MRLNESSLWNDCREGESLKLSTLRLSEEDLLWQGIASMMSPAVIRRL